MLEARLQAHYAAQWLARYGRSYLPPQSDDSHTSMLWNPSARLFLSPSSGTGTLALDIPTLTLFWLDPKGTLGTGFSLDGKTDAEAEAMLRAMLGELGLNPQRLKPELPYDLPDHAIATGAGSGAAYDVTGNAKGLLALSTLFHQGAEILTGVQGREEGASAVRCWPHHFDIATLIALDDEKDPEAAKTIGVGLSPGDDTYPEPYYYIAPWPYPDPVKLKKNEIYHWHTVGFTAAIIQALEVDQPTAMRGIGEAIAACKALLK